MLEKFWKKFIVEIVKKDGTTNVFVPEKSQKFYENICQS